MFSGNNDPKQWDAKGPKVYTEKPQGYSWFPKEIMPTPASWVAETGNLVFHKQHESGGHFAAMEKAEILWADVEEFIKVAWKYSPSAKV